MAHHSKAQKRQPRGVPIGGQFAEDVRSYADVHLQDLAGPKPDHLPPGVTEADDEEPDPQVWVRAQEVAQLVLGHVNKQKAGG